MTAPQPVPVPASRISGWVGVFVWGIVVAAGARIGWDLIGFVLDAVAGRVG